MGSMCLIGQNKSGLKFEIKRKKDIKTAITIISIVISQL